MKNFALAALACIAVPGIALAAEPAPKPEKCCCEEMKDKGKDCCADNVKSEHEGHAEHQMDAPKN